MEEKTFYELRKYCCLYQKKLRLTNLQASGRVDHVVEGSGISSSNSRKSCTTLITAATELLILEAVGDEVLVCRRVLWRSEKKFVENALKYTSPTPGFSLNNSKRAEERCHRKSKFRPKESEREKAVLTATKMKTLFSLKC